MRRTKYLQHAEYQSWKLSKCEEDREPAGNISQNPLQSRPSVARGSRGNKATSRVDSEIFIGKKFLELKILSDHINPGYKSWTRGPRQNPSISARLSPSSSNRDRVPKASEATRSRTKPGRGCQRMQQ